MHRKVWKALLYPNPLSGTTSSLIFYLIWTSLEPCKSNQSGPRGYLFRIKGIINTSSASLGEVTFNVKVWGLEFGVLNWFGVWGNKAANSKHQTPNRRLRALPTTKRPKAHPFQPIKQHFDHKNTMFPPHKP